MLTLLLTPLTIESPASYKDPVAAVNEPVPAIYSEPNNDGIYVNRSGKVIVGKKSPYELWGLSITEVNGEITFQIKSNLPLKGLPEPRAKVGRIGYGDLLLYYRNTVAGIRLTGKNKGIYYNVKAVNNAKLHFGNKTPQEYIRRLKQVKAYEPNMQFPPEWVTHIKSGSLFSKNIKVSEVKKGGYYLISVTTQRNLLPEGSFITYLPTECINDYVAGVYPLTGNTDELIEEGTPPPAEKTNALMDSSPMDPTEFSMSNLVDPVQMALADPLTLAPVVSSLAPSISPLIPLAVGTGVVSTVTSFLGGDTSNDIIDTSQPTLTAPGIENTDSTPTSPTSTSPTSTSPTTSPKLDPPEEAVPEPNTILGTALATGIGILFKRRCNQSIKK